MTVTKRKSVITIETRQRTVIYQNSRRTRWCEFCAAQAETVSSEQAAIIFDISLQKIYQAIKNGRLHFAESRNQLSAICVNSLKANK